MKKMKEWRIGLIILLVFTMCCTNVVFLEMIIRLTPAAGNMITLAQFVFISIEGFLFTTRFGTKRAVIPIKHYILLVIYFFLVSLSNNYALNFNISMPLHMIFKSGSLIANMILGILILKRSYVLSKYIAVAIITIGIVICTFSSANLAKTDFSSVDKNYDPSLNWLIGIFLMLFSLFASANMGIYQETLYTKYGKHPKEALFYTHCLPLPGFLLLSTNIFNQIVIFNQSEPYVINAVIFSLTLPKLWLYLILNAFTQYVCIRCVFILTTECTSLTVTLVVTLRKFFSLIFSIFYFQNPFTLNHWFGTFLVFSGTLLFVDIPFRFLKSKIK